MFKTKIFFNQLLISVKSPLMRNYLDVPEITKQSFLSELTLWIRIVKHFFLQIKCEIARANTSCGWWIIGSFRLKQTGSGWKSLIMENAFGVCARRRGNTVISWISDVALIFVFLRVKMFTNYTSRWIRPQGGAQACTLGLKVDILNHSLVNVDQVKSTTTLNINATEPYNTRRPLVLKKQNTSCTDFSLDFNFCMFVCLLCGILSQNIIM